MKSWTKPEQRKNVWTHLLGVQYQLRNLEPTGFKSLEQARLIKTKYVRSLPNLTAQKLSASISGCSSGKIYVTVIFSSQVCVFAETMKRMFKIGWSTNVPLTENRTIWDCRSRCTKIEDYLDVDIIPDGNDVHPVGSGFAEMKVLDEGQ